MKEINCKRKKPVYNITIVTLYYSVRIFEEIIGSVAS